MSVAEASLQGQKVQFDLEDWVMVAEPQKTAELSYYDASVANLRYFSAGFCRKGCQPSSIDASRLSWVPEYLGSLETIYDGMALHAIDFNNDACRAALWNEMSVLKKRFSELRLSVYSSLCLGVSCERHFVSLLCDRKRRKVYVLNTKGEDPSNSYLVQSALGVEKSSTSVLELSRFFASQLGMAEGAGGVDFAIEYQGTCLQKPRDCIPCTEVLLRKLVTHPDGENVLQGAVNELHENYEEVDQLRSILLDEGLPQGSKIPEAP